MGPDPAQKGLSRRGFLKAVGFTFAGSALTGCSRTPVEKAIPYLIQPEEIIPGKAYYYASTCGACPAGCGLLAKNRDGRPIKLEGNPEHPISHGGLCAVGQASILGLYDSRRLQRPFINGRPSDWPTVDAAITRQLATVQQAGGAVRLLTGNLTGPATRAVIDHFLQPFQDARHVIYEPLSSTAVVEAHQRTHGTGVLPRYRFDRADVIVSFDADFLGTWISPVEFTAGYRAGRHPDGDHPRLSHHTQFEARLSVTGSKADQRIRIAPGEMGLILSHLAKRLATRAGASFDANGLAACPIPSKTLDEITDRLWRSRGQSLVVCGIQNVDMQVLCNFVNHTLDNYGSTLDIRYPSYQRQGDNGLGNLLDELSGGHVQALLIHGVNPVYDLPDGAALADAIKRVPLVVSFAQRLDETSRLAHYICPDRHYLETWSDAEPVRGILCLSQPVIQAIGDTRPLIESLAAWSGQPRSARDILRDNQPGRESWDRTVQNGFAEIQREPAAISPFRESAVEPIRQSDPPVGDTLSLVLYSKVGMGDGSHAYNPWLQELPDPITKVVWDNYASLSPRASERLGVQPGDVVRLTIKRPDNADRTIELPVLVQPGQDDRTVAVALGYGSEETRRFAETGPRWLEKRPTVGPNGLVGTNAAPLLGRENGLIRYCGAAVRIEPTGKRHEVVTSQEYDSLSVPESLDLVGSERPPVVRETTLAAVVSSRAEAAGESGDGEHQVGLWPIDHDYPVHHWGMAIDLTACTGCSACVIACQVENNIPVVGKDEVRRNRLMHWIRIDRYYDRQRDGAVDVAYQPMLCHQCDNAPCETVCPVLATVHSDEGLNQQVYNRCIGTRYCANNCPYKVRRFNWFDYPHDDALYDLVLNPDVTVRTRGVMEKCTFCIQRIQEAKIEAKMKGEADKGKGQSNELVVQPACQQSCPANAIVFGDMNDPKSAIVRMIKSKRHYRLLEELNVKPSVGYLELVRNRPRGKSQNHHG